MQKWVPGTSWAVRSKSSKTFPRNRRRSGFQPSKTGSDGNMERVAPSYGPKGSMGCLFFVICSYSQAYRPRLRVRPEKAFIFGALEKPPSRPFRTKGASRWEPSQSQKMPKIKSRV